MSIADAVRSRELEARVLAHTVRIQLLEAKLDEMEKRLVLVEAQKVTPEAKSFVEGMSRARVKANDAA